MSSKSARLAEGGIQAALRGPKIGLLNASCLFEFRWVPSAEWWGSVRVTTPLRFDQSLGPDSPPQEIHGLIYKDEVVAKRLVDPSCAVLFRLSPSIAYGYLTISAGGYQILANNRLTLTEAGAGLSNVYVVSVSGPNADRALWQHNPFKTALEASADYRAGLKDEMLRTLGESTRSVLTAWQSCLFEFRWIPTQSWWDAALRKVSFSHTLPAAPQEVTGMIFHDTSPHWPREHEFGYFVVSSSGARLVERSRLALTTAAEALARVYAAAVYSSGSSSACQNPLMQALDASPGYRGALKAETLKALGEGRGARQAVARLIDDQGSKEA